MALFSLSKRADYGIAFLAELTKAGKGRYLSLKELSELGLPRSFLAKIASLLVKAGIVGSKDGRGGGYYLKKDPGQVSVKEALEAIEGEMFMTYCMQKGVECPRQSYCRQRRFMQSLNGHFKNILEVYTLRDLTA